MSRGTLVFEAVIIVFFNFFLKPSTIFMFRSFYAQHGICCHKVSIRLSGNLSVSIWYCGKMAKCIGEILLLSDIPAIIIFSERNVIRKLRGEYSNEGLVRIKYRYTGHKNLNIL